MRDQQHNAQVYRQIYSPNPFFNETDLNIKQYMIEVDSKNLRFYNLFILKVIFNLYLKIIKVFFFLIFALRLNFDSDKTSYQNCKKSTSTPALKHINENEFLQQTLNINFDPKEIDKNDTCRDLFRSTSANEGLVLL